MTNQSLRASVAFGLLAFGLLAVGELQSWNTALAVLNLCLISGVMALGLNMQWGYAGLFNAGVMAFAAIGGVTAVLVSHPPVIEAWQEGGQPLLTSLLALAEHRRMPMPMDRMLIPMDRMQRKHDPRYA